MTLCPCLCADPDLVCKCRGCVKDSGGQDGRRVMGTAARFSYYAALSLGHIRAGLLLFRLFPLTRV